MDRNGLGLRIRVMFKVRHKIRLGLGVWSVAVNSRGGLMSHLLISIRHRYLWLKISAISILISISFTAVLFGLPYSSRLHGSAGIMLTAITLSYGKWWNSTPHRIKPHHWLIWNCEHMITSGRYAPKSIFVKIRAAGASGESGEI